ncbi:MAG: hypothetical protein M1815_002367 [Lichina confinis]|nr:MAG: hypothetical protein M1815_002367 [Lichina confinis]
MPSDLSTKLRTRENQRRSRARRKEYLQELETRWRKCEESGAAASLELQAAARRVAEENKELRLMLRELRVPDAEINRRVVKRIEGSVAASHVDQLLTTSRECGNSGTGLTGVVAKEAGERRPVVAALPARALPEQQALLELANSSTSEEEAPLAVAVVEADIAALPSPLPSETAPERTTPHSAQAVAVDAFDVPAYLASMPLGSHPVEAYAETVMPLLSYTTTAPAHTAPEYCGTATCEPRDSPANIFDFIDPYGSHPVSRGPMLG